MRCPSPEEEEAVSSGLILRRGACATHSIGNRDQSRFSGQRPMRRELTGFDKFLVAICGTLDPQAACIVMEQSE